MTREEIDQLTADPTFLAADDATKRRILVDADPMFREADLRTQDGILMRMRPAPAEPSMTDRLKRATLPTVLGMTGGAGGRVLGGLPGETIGSAIGSAGGEAINQVVLGRTETPWRDIGVEALGGAAATPIGRLLGLTGRAITGGLSVAPRVEAPAIRQSFRNLDVPMKPSDVSAGTLASTLETSLGQTLLGRNPIRRSVQEQGERLSAGAEEFLLKRLGPDEARLDVATGIRYTNAVKANVDATARTENAMWENLARLGSGTEVDTRSIQLALRDIAAPQPIGPLRQVVKKGQEMVSGEGGERMVPGPTFEYSTVVGPARDTRGGVFKGELGGMMREIERASETVPWSTARRWQRAIGAAIERGELISETPKGEAKLLWKSVTESMEKAAAQSGDRGLAEAFTATRNFATRRRELFSDSAVARVLTANPEDVVKVIKASGGPTAIKNAREAANDPETWDYVRRHIFEGVIESAKDVNAKGFLTEVISGPKLDRALKRFGEESLAELLSPAERAILQDVVTVGHAIRTAEKYAATGMTSMTGQSAGVQTAIVAGGALLARQVGMDPTMAAVATYLLAPPVLAKIVTSPRLAEIIASPGFKSITDGMRLGGKIGEEGMMALSKLSAALATDLGQGTPSLSIPPPKGPMRVTVPPDLIRR